MPSDVKNYPGITTQDLIRLMDLCDEDPLNITNALVAIHGQLQRLVDLVEASERKDDA